MEKVLNYINGKFCEPATGDYIKNYEPATGKVYGQISDSGPDDVDTAVSAAHNAFPGWSGMPIEKRSGILHRLADVIEENLEMLAKAESRDTGKPISLATEVDIPRAAANFRFFASAIVNFSSEAHIMEGVAVNYTRRAPIGIVGCISPWNLPLYLFTWKIAPALAMGNCVIGKPSEITPMTAFILGDLANKAGLPKGVLNILHGKGVNVGKSIVAHPSVKAISFTGGTSTGRTIGKIAAENFKKVSLELGGKNPNIVFADCDLNEAVRVSIMSSFRNQGEICLCGSRILIEKSIYDAFKERFLEALNEMKMGDPGDPETEFGAVISEDHLNKIKSYVQGAKEDGGEILAGGNEFSPNGMKGYFYQPTIIEGLDHSCTINQEEVFGPVVTLLPFSNENEAVEIANSTEYGLACSIWTNDLKKAHRVAHSIKSGIIWVNCWMLRDLRTPFGGMKNSGVGREGGEEALRFFSEPQNICIKQ